MSARGILDLTLALALGASLGAQGARTQEDAAGLAKIALERIVGAKLDALDGVSLDFDEYELDAKRKPRLVARYGATLAYPDKFRLEVRRPRVENRVFLVEGDKRFFGAAGGPFVALGGQKAAEVDAMFGILTALLCWDLRPPVAEGKTRELSIVDGELRSLVRSSKTKRPTALRRRIDPKTGRVERLRLGEQEYRMQGELEGAAGTICREVREVGRRRLLRFWRIGTSWTYVPARFRPAPRSASGSTSKPTIERRAEQHNFDHVVLARVPEAFVVAVDDPGSWVGRLVLLDRLGMDLHRLEQQPVGLPDYGEAGRMRIAFLPSKKGGRPRVPKGLRFSRQRAGLAAVLYLRGTLAEAKKGLGTRLEAFAKEHGLSAATPLRLFPYVLPQPGTPPPEAEAKVLVRGELVLR